MRKVGYIFLPLVLALLAAPAHSDPPEKIAPSPQSLCNAMLKIIGWDDLTESARATNADRVRGSGLVRILGAQVASPIKADDPRYEIFFPPEPGQPHAVVPPPAAKNVAAVSSDDMGSAPNEIADRLTGLLYDGRHNWKDTRYFFTPYDPLRVAELASMWQRHARNAADLQDRGQTVFGGDSVLTSVQGAVERGLHGNKPFWAHIGFEATVDGIGKDGGLDFPNAGSGYASSVPKGSKVLVDYILMYDPTDSSKPSGMTVILRFPDAKTPTTTPTTATTP